MPAGIMREAAGSERPICEIPAPAVPESPSDVASDLAVSNSEIVPGKDVDSEVDVHSSQVDGPIGCVECSSWVTDGSAAIQVAVDAWIEEGCPCDASLGSHSPDQDIDGQQTWRENVVIELARGLEAGVSRHVSVDEDLAGSGGEGRVSRRSVGCSPETVVVVEKPAPVNFMSAAPCYVGGPSKAEMLRDTRSTQRRKSLCRFEAFVIRSRLTRAVPGRDHGSKQTPSSSQG